MDPFGAMDRQFHGCGITAYYSVGSKILGDLFESLPNGSYESR